MRRLCVAALAVMATATPVAARDRVDVRITVYDDFGACATVTSYDPGPVAGTFASAGVAAGPGTIVAPVRGATTFTLTGPGSWYGCLPPAYTGATRGQAEYAVGYVTETSDAVVLAHCAPAWGTVSCS